MVIITLRVIVRVVRSGRGGNIAGGWLGRRLGVGVVSVVVCGSMGSSGGLADGVCVRRHRSDQHFSLSRPSIYTNINDIMFMHT